jgi:putative ABC transport system ATP-binding protein
MLNPTSTTDKSNLKIASLHQVTFVYPESNLPTLDKINFDLLLGEKVFLYGPSGSGKTTLLELLAGVLTPINGEYTFKGKNISQKNEVERDAFRGTHIGYIFQSFNLLPYLTVLENVTLSSHLYPERGGFKSASEVTEQAIHLLKSLGMEAVIHSQSNQISVGQQQRVAVARALMGNPELILADEPTSSLDFDHREKFLKLLFEMCEQKKCTLLFVSHDRSIEKLFDRSISLVGMNT